MCKNQFRKLISFTLLLSTLFCLPIYSVFADEDVSISASVGDVPVQQSNAPSGGVVFIPKTSVRFSGLAYPKSEVFLLKEGKFQTFVTADDLGNFNITLEEKYSENVLYSLYAKDPKGNRSLLLNYPLVVYGGYVTYLSGIEFSPTINIDKSEVYFADSITVSGYGLSNTNVEIVISGKNKTTFNVLTKQDGSYSRSISVLGLEKGDYSIYTRYVDNKKISNILRFIVGDSTKYKNYELSNLPGDCNSDRVINLVDFSILAFWYKKSDPPVCADANGDKIINLIDFSVLAFYWSGQ